MTIFSSHTPSEAQFKNNLNAALRRSGPQQLWNRPNNLSFSREIRRGMKGTQSSRKLYPRQYHREPFLRVHPCFFETQACSAEEAGDGSGGKLVAVFGMQALPAGKVEAACEVLHPDCLVHSALQMHLDTRLPGIPKRNVVKVRKIEPPAKFAVDAIQHILVESRGYSLLVVVGGVKNPRILAHIKTQQQSVSRREGA